MFSIEPTGLGTSNKELAAIGVGASIRHREYTRLGMSQLEILVLESRTVDGFTTSTIMVGKVTTLAHEIRNHPMEAATLVTKALFSGAKSTEVLCRFGDNFASQLKYFIKIMDIVKIYLRLISSKMYIYIYI